MATIETADGEQKRVEEYELAVTAYATVMPGGSSTDYEVGHFDYGAEHSNCVSEELAEAVYDEHTVDVEDYGFEAIDLDDPDITKL